jgi:hypothetical protein
MWFSYNCIDNRIKLTRLSGFATSGRIEIKGRRTSKNFTKSEEEKAVNKKADIGRFYSATNVLVKLNSTLILTSHFKGSSGDDVTRIL